MSSNKTKKPYVVIMQRELKSYFSSLVAYIVTGLFLIITGVFFFTLFFLQNRAELRQFFGYLPIFLALFVPALTMRLFAEERRSGSIETLLTLPVTEVDVVIGKYLASFISTLVMIAPTLLYIIPVEVFGSPDYGPIVGGYLAAILLCASYSAIGLFASSITKNQIISFLVGLIICMGLTMIDTFLLFLPAPVVSFFSYLSATAHFASVARGILDTRDLIYFVSLTALFFIFTVKSQQNAKN